MGHDDDRDAVGAVEVEQDVFHHGAGRAVEVSGRFVRKNHAGVVHQCAGDDHSLLLPTREVGGFVFRFVGELQLLERSHPATTTLRATNTRDTEGECDVVEHTRARGQEELLEHKPKRLVAGFVERAATEGGSIPSAQLHLSLTRFVEKGEQVHQGRLARSAFAHNGDGLAGVDIDRDTLECLESGGATTIRLVDVAGREHGYRHCCSFRWG